MATVKWEESSRQEDALLPIATPNLAWGVERWVGEVGPSRGVPKGQVDILHPWWI